MPDPKVVVVTVIVGLLIYGVTKTVEVTAHGVKKVDHAIVHVIKHQKEHKK